MRDTLRDMRTCHEVGQWLQHYLDGELEPGVTAQVEEHLETCVRCGLEYDTFSRIKTALHEASSDSPELIGDEIALRRLRQFADGLTGHNSAGA
jgi:anti-sigma factor RsiW